MHTILPQSKPVCQRSAIQTRLLHKRRLTAVDLERPETVLSVLMTDFDEIYRGVGRKIRQTQRTSI